MHPLQWKKSIRDIYIYIYMSVCVCALHLLHIFVENLMAPFDTFTSMFRHAYLWHFSIDYLRRHPKLKKRIMKMHDLLTIGWLGS